MAAHSPVISPDLKSAPAAIRQWWRISLSGRGGRQGYEHNQPGFARWIEVTPPKGLEILAKTWIPTFTRCPAHFLRLRLGKPLVRQESWRVPAGESPVRVRGSARPVASVAAWKATTTAKRTQQSCGVWD